MEQYSFKHLCRFLSALFVCSSLISNVSYAIKINVADSPETNLALALNAINSAKKNLVVNAYELNSPEIAQALQKKIKSIPVTILLEGQPVGGIGDAGIQIRDLLVAAMNRSSLPHKFLVMSSKNPNGERSRRFRYNHAKYIIVDGSSLLVGSENYSVSGHPAEGSKGTRGWETLIHDNGLASSFMQLFKTDSSMEHGDVYLISEKRARSFIPFLGQWEEDMAQMVSFEQSRYYSQPVEPIDFEVPTISQLTSPNTSTQGLLNFIKSAKKALDVELMSFSYRWGNTGNVSPLFSAIVDAARRGVEVRVLLNDERAFGGGERIEFEELTSKTSPNLLVVEQLQAISKKEGLRLDAGIADLKSMGVKYIHNKGAIADGERVLVSSINWNRNSLENNRETAVVIHSQEVSDYYKELFESDWNVSR
ncbi:MAG: phospholipase D-like domain-containing protein [Deltaproteobacteria bacterium]|jgi:phosphatidylserine/phosphatidylglycerophosphate/cardiolipin synthase-like enzyme